ncbi:MAG: YkgJ family cysteine cluster protein [Candidatus Nanoarchaeia archaeon]|nr:YkgJ family cysteine cluster protein [Candidatus Nanoarchaeia archaeon]
MDKLSEECIKNKGLCCEKRTPPFLLPGEIENLLIKENDSFEIKGDMAYPKGLCCFFNEPFCTVYKKRPVDCRTYPVSITRKWRNGFYNRYELPRG